jgi:hypothetical protein
MPIDASGRLFMDGRFLTNAAVWLPWNAISIGGLAYNDRFFYSSSDGLLSLARP